MISRNHEVELDIINRIQNQWNSKTYNRTGYALYEILHPRKAYFDRTQPKPPTIEDICYFISGKSIERGFTDSIGLDHGKNRTASGINYSVDIRCQEYPIIEIKSRRSNLPDIGEEEDTFAHYLNQLRAYMALDRISQSTLVVVSLNEKVDDSWKTQPVIAAYTVQFDEMELKRTRTDLKIRKQALKSALEGEIPFTELPLCEDWMCGRKIKTCTKAPMCETCKGREFANDYLLKRHTEGKSGKGHTVKYGEYEYTFEPTCKYFNDCRVPDSRN
jgi:hypothetical protein